MKKTNQGFQPRKLNLKKQTVVKLASKAQLQMEGGTSITLITCPDFPTGSKKVGEDGCVSLTRPTSH